jgi:prepilin-type processing-associated H-X9-DG protein
MNYVTNGPNGRRLPDISRGNGTFVLDSDTTHYPVRRHQGVFTALYCDGHVGSLQQTDLLDSMFQWSGE